MATIESKIQNLLAEPIAIVMVVCVFSWSILVGYSLYWNMTTLQNYTDNLVLLETQSDLNKEKLVTEHVIVKDSIPLHPYTDVVNITIKGIKQTHVIVWVLGFVALIVFYAFAYRRQKERNALLVKLEHAGLYDSLTELPNRVLFKDRLIQTIHKQQRDKNLLFAVCFIDLDRFKHINDSFGHEYGDVILCEVSRRLGVAVRSTDSVARNSGDEYTVLLDDVSGIDEVLMVVRRILRYIEEPFHVKSNVFNVGASIGVCLCDGEFSESDDIIRNADTAMYRAKQQGKGRIEIYNPEMQVDIKNTTRIEHGLKQAIKNNELEVYYQPVFNTGNGVVEGFEALLRWHHPQDGMIPPDIFIPIAEDIGIIDDIGIWVLDQACCQISKWNKDYVSYDPFSVAVNFSSKQITNDEIVNVVGRALYKYDLKPEMLHCELTETALLQNRQAAKRNLQEIKEMGVKIHADDFGKGYSSLTYLHDFNFDTLKIDKEFVNDMGPGAKGEKLTKTLIRLAKDMEMSVIAEGVETQEQFNILSDMKCEAMQGYFLSPPLPASGIESIILNDGHRSLGNLLKHTASKHKVKMVS